VESKYRGHLGAAMAAVASAILYFYGTGIHPHWYLTWIAPIPVLVAVPRISRWAAAIAAFAAFALGELNLVAYALRIIPLPIIILLVVFPAAFFAASTFIFRIFVKRRQLIWAVISLPALWTAFEFLTEFRSIHGTFGNLAYTQMNCLPIVQIVSITGIWSVSFLLLLLPAAVAAILAPGATMQQKRAIALGASLTFGAVLGFGVYRLHCEPVGTLVRVGLIDTDAAESVYPEGQPSVELVLSYAKHIPELAREGAEVVVIPEKIGRFNESEIGESDGILRQAASQNHVTIVAGLLHLPNRNEARIYSPDGMLEATYEKHHMLPPFESGLAAGKTRTILIRPSGKWGVEICKDMDFPALSRQYGADGVGLLLVPAWDFVEDGWLHGRMAILRGIESGFSIVRVAKQGELTVTDNRGGVLAEQTTGAAPFNLLVTSVRLEKVQTFYDQTGDWFAWFDLALLVIIFISLARRRPSGASR